MLFIGLLFLKIFILLLTLGSDSVLTYTVIGFAILMGGGTVWCFINPNKQIIPDNSNKKQQQLFFSMVVAAGHQRYK